MPVAKWRRNGRGAAGVRSRQRAAASSRRSASLATVKYVRSAVARSLETKTAGYLLPVTDMYHNQGHYVTGLLNTRPGDGSNPGFGTPLTDSHYEPPECRIGSEIMPLGMKLRFLMETEETRPNCVFHIYVFRYKSNMSVTDPNFWCGEEGMNSTAIDRIIDEPNTQSSLGLKILKKLVVQHQPNYAVTSGLSDITEHVDDALVPAVAALVEAAIPGAGELVAAVNSATETIQSLVDSAGSTNRICSTMREIWVPYTSKVKYPSYEDSNEIPSDWNLGVCCLPYDSNNTSTSSRL